MARQEVHTCDVCGEEFMVPQESLRKLKLEENNEVTFDFDLCFECSKSLKAWIISNRNIKKEA